MEAFDSNEKNSKVVWRDNQGRIVCNGDACPQKCDDTCPIWCQTMAISLMRIGQEEKAIEEFKKALSIAPDFKDAWVNLAAIYGGKDNHLEANKAYQSAYAIDNNYKNAIFGLIFSFKNLGQFEEALKYCDEYSNKINPVEGEKLKNQVIMEQSAGLNLSHPSAISIAQSIISTSRRYGVLGENDNFPNIPELMVESKSICSKILEEMCKNEDGRDPVLWLAWSAYAGMGSVYHWQIDWFHLKLKGIAETLLEPRGLYCMDEYVLDTIGIEFDSEEGQQFSQKIFDISMWVFQDHLEKAPRGNAMEVALEAMQAMFIFGMVYEMERLGLR